MLQRLVEPEVQAYQGVVEAEVHLVAVVVVLRFSCPCEVPLGSPHLRWGKLYP